MTEGSEGRVDRVKEPEVRDLASREVGIATAGGANCEALGIQDFDQPLQQKKQTRARADLQDWRHKPGIVDEMAGAVAQHPTEGQGQKVAYRLGFGHDANILPAEADRALVVSGIFIMDDLGLG